jgi:hypothetical protein
VVRGRGRGQPTPEGSTGLQRGGPSTRGGQGVDLVDLGVA